MGSPAGRATPWGLTLMRTRNALLPVPRTACVKGTLMPVISEDPTTTGTPAMRKGRDTPYGVRPEQIAAMTNLYPGHLTWRRTFAGVPGQIREARHFVAFLLADAECREDAGLIVSELATNAVSHTSSGNPHGTFVVGSSRLSGVALSLDRSA
jgi:hypothetical protein